MRFLLPWAASLMVMATTDAGAAAELPGPRFPVYANVAELVAACDSGLAAAGERVTALEKHAADASWLAALDALNAYVEDVSAPFSVIQNTHPDKAMRDAAQACQLRWADFESTFGQNEQIYRAARDVVSRDAIDRSFARDTREDFEDSGVALPPEQRRRAKEISDRIAALGQEFQQRVRDADIKVAFAPAELAGVPDAVWATKPRDGEGRVLLGLDSPTYLPVVQLADRAVARERMWRAKQNEGGAANLMVLAELAALRREYAGLFGLPSFGDFQLRRRMAENTANAQRFLDEVRGAVTERERRDLEELRLAKAAQLGTPLTATQLDRWDVAYYLERVRRERYSVDQEAFRPYFPPEASLKVVMRIAEKMLGIRYERVPIALWHADVQAYAVSDAATGRPLATFYVDLYPREGKYSHAAVWSMRNESSLTGRTPQAVLVVNLNREGLTLQELETLLHELGHALHNNLSTARYMSQAGTRVQRDFVEAPSQMLEDWVYDKRVLQLFSEVCPSCKPVPDAMIERARVARDYGKGIQTARQLLYASYDLALYSTEVVDPLALWARMEGSTPLGHVPGTMFPAGFGHSAVGYAAGYYGYLWSLVVAMDLRTAFAADRLDPGAGARYRRTILARGRELPPRELVREFLGRETNAKAFFEDLQR